MTKEALASGRSARKESYVPTDTEEEQDEEPVVQTTTEIILRRTRRPISHHQQRKHKQYDVFEVSGDDQDADEGLVDDLLNSSPKRPSSGQEHKMDPPLFRRILSPDQTTHASLLTTLLHGSTVSDAGSEGRAVKTRSVIMRSEAAPFSGPAAAMSEHLTKPLKYCKDDRPGCSG